MKVSVIIATYNRLALLQRTLPLVFGQDFPAEEFEVIVVDDGSRDATAAYLEALRPPCAFRYLSQVNAGQAAAINAGLKIARGEIVVFLDDDIECTPGLIRAHAEQHDGTPTRLVFGPVLMSRGQKQSFATEWIREYCDDFFAKLDENPSQAESGWFLSFGNANTSGRREFLVAHGGLRENLIRSNDLEFGFRMQKAGGKFAYASKAVAYQHWAKPIREIAITEPRLEGEAEVMMCREHPEYRKRSRLMSFATGPWWKRGLRSALVAAPFDLSYVLFALVAVLAPFAKRAPLRKLTTGLLRASIGTARYRGAIAYCGGFEVFRRQFGMRVPALLYHHIGAAKPGEFHGLSISVAEFRSQLRWLRNNNYQSITPEDWANWVERGVPLPSKPVMITFDDAYADMEDRALPLLEEFGFFATIYVVTDEIGGSNLWDQENGYPAIPLMSAEQICRWSKKGMRFAAHSRTHPDLRKLSDDRLQDELAGSRDALRELIGEPVTSFANPYGYYDNRCATKAAECFTTVMTCEEGMNDASVPLNRLRRTALERAFSWVDPAPRAWWGINPLQRLRLYMGLARRRLFRMHP